LFSGGGILHGIPHRRTASPLLLSTLPLFKARLQEERHAQLSVQLDAAVSTVETVLGELKALAMTVTNLDIQTSRDDAGQRVVFYLQYKQANLPRMPLDVTQRIGRLPGVRTTHWKS
jgi:hypothetical protein